MATPRTPRTPRTPGSSSAAAVPKTPTKPVTSNPNTKIQPATPSASSPSARAKLYAKKAQEGKPLPPSASRNPDLVSWARSQVMKPAATAKAPAQPTAPSEMKLASYRKPLPQPPQGLNDLGGGGSSGGKGASGSWARTPTYGPTAPPPKYGTKSNYVVSLQHYLKNSGFDPGPVDGVYGPKTEAALKAYEAKKGPAPWTTIANKAAPEKSPSSGGFSPASASVPPPSSGKYRAPSDAVAYANKYGKQYGVDPRLLLAIAKHETGFGTLGLGRRGLDLGYGAFDSGASYAWQGRENQYMYGAKWLAAHGVRTLDDLRAGKASSWATDPNWEAGVTSAYGGI